jgi:prepilin-type processing-associated H-X9-DG protein
MVRLSAAKKTNRDAFTRIPASGAESLSWKSFLKPDGLLVFKCASDRSETKLANGVRYPRLRTYSMNGYMGTTAAAGNEQIATTFLKRSDFSKLRRAEYLVFVDVHEDFLDLCNFNLAWDIGRELWHNVPTSRHNGRGTLSYTDNHVELHRWLDARTRPRVEGIYRQGEFLGAVTGSPDWRYMKDRLTKGTAAYGDP